MQLLTELFPPVIDYFAEYRQDPEIEVTGVNEVGDTWKVSVAKAGGGTLGKTYDAGEKWIVHLYVADGLVDSFYVEAAAPKTHEDTVNEFAAHYFGYKY